MPTDAVMPDIPRIYTAVSEWFACMIVILCAEKRFGKLQTAALCIAAFIVISAFQLIAGILPIGFWLPCMICAALLMCLFIWLVTNNGVKSACYYGVQSFIVAELISSVEWWLYYFFASNYPWLGATIASVVFAAAVYGAFFTAMMFVERRFVRKRHVSVSAKDLFVAAVIVASAFLISNISFMQWNTPLSSKYALEIFYIRTIVDFCGLLLLYGNRSVKIANDAEAELTQMRLLLARQYEQYCMTKEAVDAVNRHYHDLKHQMAMFNGRDGAVQYVKDVENEIKFYDTVYKTGNDILDTILTSKSALFAHKGITFTCVANGAELSFMSDMDICSLFGNALDNAIESFDGNPDGDNGEAKLIKLAVYKNHGLLIIRCENTFRGKLRISNSELLTTKREKENHGYGVKSIKRVAEKYGGTADFAATGEMFVLGVVIPVDNKEA